MLIKPVVTRYTKWVYVSEEDGRINHHFEYILCGHIISFDYICEGDMDAMAIGIAVSAHANGVMNTWAKGAPYEKQE